MNGPPTKDGGVNADLLPFTAKDPHDGGSNRPRDTCTPVLAHPHHPTEAHHG